MNTASVPALSHIVSAPNEVDISCKNINEPPWLGNVTSFIMDILSFEGFEGWSLSILFCDNNYIQTLNRTFRNKDLPTDVLSFSQSETVAKTEGDSPHRDNTFNIVFYAGDIVVSLDSLAENALYFDVDEEEELKRLLVHGILHLAGWEHSDNSLDQEMLKKQEYILSVFSHEKIY